MANKYLDQSGVQYLWGKIKDKADATLLAAEKAAKEYVNGLLGMTDEDNKVVDKIKEVLDVFKNYEEEKNLVELLNNKLDKTDGGTITGNVTVSGSLTASGYFEASSGVTTDSIMVKHLTEQYLLKRLMTALLVLNHWMLVILSHIWLDYKVQIDLFGEG